MKQKCPRHLRAIFSAPHFLALMMLPGCAEKTERSIAFTADSVLQAQYNAEKRPGALSGEEAGKIYRTYADKIGAQTSSPAVSESPDRIPQ